MQRLKRCLYYRKTTNYIFPDFFQNIRLILLKLKCNPFLYSDNITYSEFCVSSSAFVPRQNGVRIPRENSQIQYWFKIDIPVSKSCFVSFLKDQVLTSPLQGLLLWKQACSFTFQGCLHFSAYTFILQKQKQIFFYSEYFNLSMLYFSLFK